MSIKCKGCKNFVSNSFVPQCSSNYCFDKLNGKCNNCSSSNCVELKNILIEHNSNNVIDKNAKKYIFFCKSCFKQNKELLKEKTKQLKEETKQLKESTEDSE